MSNQWFSEKQLTKEAAQELHQLKPLEFFSPAFVGRTPEGGFVMGKLRMKSSSNSGVTPAYPTMRRVSTSGASDAPNRFGSNPLRSSGRIAGKIR